MIRTGVTAVVLVLAFVAAACGDPVEGKRGAELFGVACAHCHGSDLSGGVGPALGAGSPASGLTDAQIGGAISVGPGSMPSFGRRLTNDQIESLIAYLRLLQAGG